jgi:chromosomal replication initiation ATPase DnaA
MQRSYQIIPEIMSNRASAIRISQDMYIKSVMNKRDFRNGKPKAYIYAGIVNYSELKFSPEDIIKISCEAMGLTPDFIKRRSRLRPVAFGRQVCMYLCCKYTNCTLQEVGSAFMCRDGKGYDHATVLHAKRTIANLMTVDKDIRKKVIDVELFLTSSIGTKIID